MKIGIVTDSGCDLPPQLLAKYPILCIPLHVSLAGAVFNDWQDITPTTLYPRMLEEDIIPDTASAPQDTFIEIYKQALTHYDAVFSVHTSRHTSDTYQRARNAIETLGLKDKVIFINTSTFNAALANIVLELAQHIREGITDLEFLLQEALHIRDNSMTLYAAHDYTWLVASKHISGARATIENMRNTRPILQIKEGVLQHTHSAPRHDIVEALVDNLEQHFGRLPIALTLATAGVMPVAQVEFQKAIQASQLKIAQARIQMIGASTGKYLGPSAIGVTAFRYEA